MKISKREREAAAKYCNMRACWWINSYDHTLLPTAPTLAGSAFLAAPPQDSMAEDWLEAEALLRDGWSPT